ncbi:MAG TPA: SRPBCC family protein [Blastocatellia bacterium]|nr:SRPBCC family protein [Blastocatellia bacterium]
MNRNRSLIGAMGLGAGLMYLFDPERGRRRRARVRDKMAHAINKTGNAIDVTSRDIRNRARGILAQAGSLIKEERVSDEVLVQRVRSKMGRIVSHPHSIQVTADNGRVTLRGPILEREVNDLLKCVTSLRGVSSVDNQLEPHAQSGHVPGLQGGVTRPGEPFELMQSNWSPSARLLAGTAGGALALYGARRGGVSGAAASALGIGLLARGLTNTDIKRLIGVGGGRRAVDIQKDINIAAPVERVFEFFTNCENFPHFMRNVRQVRKVGEDRYHWTVAGPAGISVEWDSEITKLEANRLLAWKSVTSSLIEHAGIIRFDPNPDGSTRVDIKMSYNPPAGVIGHVIATLFGANPKKELDEDLVRMKTMIETGKAPHDAADRQPLVSEASAHS